MKFLPFPDTNKCIRYLNKTVEQLRDVRHFVKHESNEKAQSAMTKTIFSLAVSLRSIDEEVQLPTPRSLQEIRMYDLTIKAIDRAIKKLRDARVLLVQRKMEDTATYLRETLGSLEKIVTFQCPECQTNHDSHPYHPSQSSLDPENQTHLQTLTTGPFLLPIDSPGGTTNNRLVVVIANPTKVRRMASLHIDQLPILENVHLPAPVSVNQDAITPTGFGFDLQPIAPYSFLRFDLSITPTNMNALRVTTIGDYAVDDHAPVAGKLEITVTGGLGRSQAPGLMLSDLSLTFHYQNFSVEDG